MYRHLTFFFLFWIPAIGHAESLTPASAVARALSHNPDLRAVRLAIAEAAGRLRGAGRLANPELETEVKPSVHGREYSIEVGVMQRFPLTDRLRLEKAVSEAQVTVAEAEVQAAERRLAADVRTLAVKLQSLKDRQSLAQAQIANSDELALIAAQTAAKGEGSPLEAAQLELESQQLALDLLRVDAERHALTSALRPLLGLPVDAPIAISGELGPPRVPEETSTPLPDRPELQAAEARSRAARHTLALEMKNRWQDAAVGLAAEIDRSEDAPDGLQTDGFIGLKFSLPLPLWQKNDGRIMEAEASAQRRDAEAEALLISVRAEAASARAGMAAAARIYNQTSGSLLAKSRELEGRFLAAYQAGQAPLTDVLRSREKRLVLESARIAAQTEFHLARVRYETAVGR